MKFLQKFLLLVLQMEMPNPFPHEFTMQLQTIYEKVAFFLFFYLWIFIYLLALHTKFSKKEIPKKSKQIKLPQKFPFFSIQIFKEIAKQYPKE